MFNLEKLERSVITFLILGILSGLGVTAYKKSRSAVEVSVKSFKDGSIDYIGHVTTEGKKVNVNEAQISDLMSLEGVGKVLAERIITYRESKGPFKSITEIKEVKGIGDKLFENIEGSLTVE